MNNTDKEDSLTLELLAAIDDQSDVTQRHLADRLGVALGLANSYLKRCARKGLIKIQQAPANRYLYYLTPKGFAEKSRLTAKYLSVSFEFYRKASNSYTAIFRHCSEDGIARVALCGISELAEIATLRAQEFDINVVGCVDFVATKDKFLNKPVWGALPDNQNIQAVVFTALNRPELAYKYLSEDIENNKILVPDFLSFAVEKNKT